MLGISVNGVIEPAKNRQPESSDARTSASDPSINALARVTLPNSRLDAVLDGRLVPEHLEHEVGTDEQARRATVQPGVQLRVAEPGRLTSVDIVSTSGGHGGCTARSPCTAPSRS